MRSSFKVINILTVILMFCIVVIISPVSAYDETDDVIINYSTSGEWGVTTFVDVGVMKYSTDVAVDREQCAHISYYANGNLMYATNAGGHWTISIIAQIGTFDTDATTSIALDGDDRVHIAYYDFDEHSLNMISLLDGAWADTIIDSSSGVGSFQDMVLDSQDHVHIAYNDRSNACLKYATNSTGMWSTSTIDENARTDWKYYSIDIDSNDSVYITYYSITYIGGYKQNLMCATNSGGSWNTFVIDNEGNAGWCASLAIDSKDVLHISYFNGTARYLMYATNSGGIWTKTVVDPSLTSGYYNSIVVGPDDNVSIAYYYGVESKIMYATNVDGIWTCSPLDINQPSQGNDCPSLVIDLENKMHIVHYNVQCGNVNYATNRYASPSIPTNLTAIPDDSGVHLTWSCPENDGGASIDYYHVYVDGEECPVHFNSTNASIFGLTNGESYNFTVSAHNHFFDGMQTEVVIATPATVPNAPKNLVAEVTNDCVTLRWMEPTWDGGASIDYFVIYQNGVDVKHVEGNSTTITGLVDGNSYEFIVTAHNSAGNSRNLSSVTVTYSTSSDISDDDFPLMTVGIIIGVIVAISMVVLIVRRSKG